MRVSGPYLEFDPNFRRRVSKHILWYTWNWRPTVLSRQVLNDCHDRSPLIRSVLGESNLKSTGAVLIGFGQVGQPQCFPVSRETPPFARFSGWARWKGPDGRKRCSVLALWVRGSSNWPTVTKDGLFQDCLTWRIPTSVSSGHAARATSQRAVTD